MDRNSIVGSYGFYDAERKHQDGLIKSVSVSIRKKLFMVITIGMNIFWLLSNIIIDSGNDFGIIKRMHRSVHKAERWFHILKIPWNVVSRQFTTWASHLVIALAIKDGA